MPLLELPLVLPNRRSSHLPEKEPSHKDSVSVAAYFRTSRAHQASLDWQCKLIQEFAAARGFVVVRHYVDFARSGLALTRRHAFQELLRDILSGKANYKCVLVNDVSRWGRFQDSDEAAHYEFLCKTAGVPIIYCQEIFKNDGTPASSMLKNIQRAMAGEYSRELSDKCFRAQSRLAALGFRAGGKAGYGLRRMAISVDGTRRILERGESRLVEQDRIILVPGPRQEVACVRKIFGLALTGMSLVAIAQELNNRGMPYSNGKPWSRDAIERILSNPKYAGVHCWNRTSAKLGARASVNPIERWITQPTAFPAIIERNLFDRIQKIVKNRCKRWTDRELVDSLKRLLHNEGRISERLVANTSHMASLATYHRRLGPFKKIWKALGYSYEPDRFDPSDQAAATQYLRDAIVDKLSRIFPESVSIVRLKRKRRPLLLFDGHRLVSVLVCRAWKREKEWVMYPAAGERNFATLICFPDKSNKIIARYYLVPRVTMTGSKIVFTLKGTLLEGGVRLRTLSGLREAIQALPNAQQKLPDMIP
jgi:DNA invertase Pin-like site-specific DNA recombinase